MWLLLLSVLPMCYPPPVTAPIAVPFEAPACTYCPGQRGVEYELASGTVVRAAAAGTVTFAGVVVGIRYVVVLHDDAIGATYGMLRSSSLAAGDRVVAAQIIGTSSEGLYFGLKDPAGEPLDPTGLLAVTTRRPRLVPTDGTAPRQAEQRPSRCPGTVPRGGSPR